MIGIIVGSDSDLKYFKSSVDILEEFKIKYEFAILSAHRTPDKVIEWIKEIERKSYKVIIAGAGASAHLPGVISSYTQLPVIGVPIPSTELNGIDAVMSMLQMPAPIPVATVGIGSLGAKNAVILAMRIIALYDETIKKQLEEYIKKTKEQVVEKNDKIKRIGFYNYLSAK